MMSEVCKDTEIETKMKESFKQTMTHLHLWCFQSTVVWEESAKSFTRVWHKWYLKRETFRCQFQLTGFEQKFALCC